MRTVITYGTYDLFHPGHLRLLQRARELGDKLYVGVSTDDFNALKGKKSVYTYDERKAIVEALRCVDLVFPENDWDQKAADVVKYGASTFVMGDDWTGKFDFLKEHCDVRYLPRTDGVSSTELKELVRVLSPENIRQIEDALNRARDIIKIVG